MMRINNAINRKEFIKAIKCEVESLDECLPLFI